MKAALMLGLVFAGGAAGAEGGGLAERYAEACHALSAEDCRISRPLDAADRGRLECLFGQLDARGGEGAAAAHVGWAEAYATTGKPPSTGFPATLQQQEILVAALIACRGSKN